MKGHTGASLGRSCLVLCVQTNAENWRAFSVEIMWSLCVKWACVTQIRQPQILVISQYIETNMVVAFLVGRCPKECRSKVFAMHIFLHNDSYG